MRGRGRGALLAKFCPVVPAGCRVPGVLCNLDQKAGLLGRWKSAGFVFLAPLPEEPMATHPGVLLWRIPGTGARWAAVYGVAQSRQSDLAAAAAPLPRPKSQRYDDMSLTQAGPAMGSPPPVHRDLP